MVVPESHLLCLQLFSFLCRSKSIKREREKDRERDRERERVRERERARDRARKRERYELPRLSF